ncbi:MAG: frataxin family protein [Rickettsiales bacterium]
MNEKRYHAIADATLMHCFDRLDDAFEAGALDELELEQGILTIKSTGGRIYLLTKHAPSLQLWYASPNLGGLHFTFDEGEQRWLLPDKRGLYDILRGELHAEHVEVVL